MHQLILAEVCCVVFGFGCDLTLSVGFAFQKELYDGRFSLPVPPSPPPTALLRGFHCCVHKCSCFGTLAF